MKFFASYEILFRNMADDKVARMGVTAQFSSNVLPKAGEKMLRPALVSSILVWTFGCDYCTHSEKPGVVIDVEHCGYIRHQSSPGFPMPKPEVLSQTVQIMVDDGRVFQTFENAQDYMFQLSDALRGTEGVHLGAMGYS